MSGDELDEVKSAIMDQVVEFCGILAATIFPEPGTAEFDARMSALIDEDFMKECTEMMGEILTAIDNLRHRELSERES